VHGRPGYVMKKIFGTDTSTVTALHEAPSKGQIAVITSLLERGTEVDALGRSGSTPLDKAERGEHSEVVNLLLDHCADPDAQVNDIQTAS
jgi:ankyrin repeat protein